MDSSKQISSGAFDEMCVNYELHICGDLKPPPYQEPNIQDIISYAEGLFTDNYIYQKDSETESYDYMSDSPMRGDCDDLVITLLEDLISIGYVDNGQAKWVFGVINGERHAWLLITKEEETYIFDTYNPFGNKYTNVSNNYKEEFLVYRY